MRYFLQFKANKQDPWRMYTEEQLKDPSQLTGPPAFQTVLMVDEDPEAVVANELNPLETVKYFGPMYLDFDDENNIDRVLDEVRLVLDYLTGQLEIPEQFINCWLSGNKGVHITVPGAVFGLKSPTKWLPYIYREIMLTIQSGAGLDFQNTVDKSVYSCGRGRMWRCEGIPRPGSGTYKVSVTIDELQQMDAEMYATLVSNPRPRQAIQEPAKNVVYPKCTELFKKAKATAGKRVKAQMEATTVPKDVFRNWEGIPGCVETLITKGDCGESNWNQAALQLASYIAATYERNEEATYMDLLVKPFVKNVESSSRPTESERMKQVRNAMNRTFNSQFKFAPGAFLAVIGPGNKCGCCPVCNQGLATGETAQEDEAPSQYNKATSIKWDDRGYWVMGENGRRQLTTFTFWPEIEVRDLLPATQQDGSIGWKESVRQELQGYLIDDEGVIHRDVRIPERAWGSKRELISAIKGHGDALVYCGDGDTQRMLKAITYFGRMKAENKELEKMTRSTVCGIVLDRQGTKVIPHYIEADGSITTEGVRSAYRYNGNPRQSPALLAGDNPYTDDEDLEIAIRSLCQINELVPTALALGWFASNHFREHIQFCEPQYPILNISGNAEAGKTSMAMAMALINGIDYSVSEYMNVEVGSDYPLLKYVSSSTTVPRLIEEVNPALLGTRYAKVAMILKAAWNKSPVQRGRIGADRDLTISEDRVSAPLVYTSEQSATMPALRGRSVEVRLQSRTLLDPERRRHYALVIQRKASLFRLARAMVTVAMRTSPAKLLEVFHSKDPLISQEITARPRWGHKTCLTGLHMLMVTMDEFGVRGTEEVKKLYDGLISYLGGQVVESERGRSTSEVDRVLTAMNVMADDSSEDRYRLQPGKHYWRQGDSLYLILQSCLPRYKIYSRTMGEPVVIQAMDQMKPLITGEIYFERIEPLPGREETEVFVISLEALAKRGTSMNNFVESACAEEV